MTVSPLDVSGASTPGRQPAQLRLSVSDQEDETKYGARVTLRHQTRVGKGATFELYIYIYINIYISLFTLGSFGGGKEEVVCRKVAATLPPDCPLRGSCGYTYSLPSHHEFGVNE